jgi:hypothetical protein
MRFNKTQIVVTCFALVVGCNPFRNPEVNNIKDLDDNMIDLRMFHENLGDALIRQDQDVALWLFNGMDSLLVVVADKFDTHRKLDKPFRHAYEKDLEPPIRELGAALHTRDWPAAAQAYTMLTKKCNGCHIDRDVDKVVQNWLERGKN